MPFFLGLVWKHPYGRQGWLRLAGRLIAFGAPLALAAAALLAFNAYRFGNPFDFGYSETFNGSVFAGLLGFAFSLDRSLFLFAPPLVALFWSLPAFIRRHGALAWQILAVPLAALVLYGLWPVFWGGPVWGPRYLLPALPITFMFLLPTAEQAVFRAGWQRVALLVLGVLGVLMQLRGVIWNSLPATQTLGQRYPLWLLPVQREQLDVIWAVYRPAGALVAIAMLILAALALWRRSNRLLLVAILGALAGSILLIGWMGGSPLGYVPRPAYRSALDQLAKTSAPGDTLILNPAPYQNPIDEIVWFLNEPGATMPFFGVLRLPEDLSRPSDDRIDDLLGKNDRLWLLTEGVGPGDPQSTTENYLDSTSVSAGTAWLEDGFRLSHFEAPLPARAEGAPKAIFGGEQVLQSWNAAWAAGRPETVQVAVLWSELKPSPDDLHAFIQVLDPAGQAIAVWDTSLPSGVTTLPYQVALPVPKTAAGQQLRIITGLYRASTGERLRLPDGSDALELTGFVSGAP